MPMTSERRRDRTLSAGGQAASRPHRRRFLRTALLGGVGLSLLPPALAEEDKPGSDDRPKPGDLFVFAEGDREGEAIAPADIPPGGPQIMAWPMDPATKVVRDGSRLNQVLLLRLDPEELDEATRPRSAEGVVAYSAICAHAGCPVTGWVEDQGVQLLKCFCHNSEYDPRRTASVVFGPASRHLAALPVKIVDGALTVASKFIGSVVPQQQS
jgi:rieske iron-sulfur protein